MKPHLSRPEFTRQETQLIQQLRQPPQMLARCRPAQPDTWRHTQQKRLKSGAVPKVIAALAEPLEAAVIPDEEAPVRGGHRYLSNHLDCLDYPGALALGLGLPIGSGMIESGHRHVLQARLKKAGTAWHAGTCRSDRPTCAPMTNGSPSGISRVHF